MAKHVWFGSWVASLACSWGGLVLAADLQGPFQDIRSVAAGGQGNRAAAAAWQRIVQAEPRQLTEVLAAMDGANPLAMNWLRSAAETIAERALAAGGKLPADHLERFIKETRHEPLARRLAFELLTRVDPTTPERLIPGMLQDPGTEFRRDAVARLIAAAQAHEQGQRPAEARAAYAQALTGAVDPDQVDAVVKGLTALGQKVDVARHFGFIMDWHLVGPFDNTDKKGFDVPYPPEQRVDLQAKYIGKIGEIGWTTTLTSDQYGIVDLAVVQAPHKGAVTYAYTEFTSDRAQDVDLRLGSPNAYKVWVNGEYIFGRDEYHRGMQIDQYRMRAKLKPGKNQILLKLCQNEQKEEWAQRWQFQVRICDATGTAILSTTRPASTEVTLREGASRR